MRFAFVFLSLSALFGTVRGIVHDPQHRPVPGANVVVQALHSQFSISGQSNASGEFEFPRVPVGEYTVTATETGFKPVSVAVTVQSNEAPILHLALALATASQTTTVEATAGAVDVQSSTPTTTIGQEQINRTPGANRSNSLAMITDYVPGAYMVHDQLHLRGGHQVSWLVDGVPVPNTSIASNVGPQFDPKDIESLDALRGSYDAEFGDRTYGVFNIVPRTGFDTNNQGELVVSAGNFYQTNAQLNFGSHTDKFAYYASINGNRSSLGLSTPSPEVLHDAENGVGGFQSLIYNLDPKDQFRLAASERRDFYQIPNPPDQAGSLHDAQREADAFANLSWVRTINSGTLFTVSPFYHYNRANYEGAANDFPIATTDERSSNYAGAQTTLSVVAGPSNTEIGFYGFAQHDQQLFRLRYNDGSNPNFQQNQPASGNLEEEFAEEKVQPAPWLTLMGGLRQSHFGSNQAGSFAENATAPRVGVAVEVPGLHWVLRGNYGRNYQAPPLVTASGPLLRFVTSQDLGFIPLRGERDEEWQAGVTIPLAGWALDGDYFHNHAHNFFDHNNVGNSNVFFPLTIALARIYGFEATLRSPQLWRRGQVHAAFSNQIAEGEGPITGGLTDFAPPNNLFFLLDHDQRNTFNGGADWILPKGAYLSGNVYYGSGFANGAAPPAHLPAHASVDLTLGKQWNDALSTSFTALNVANTHLLTDNSFTFGGTHFNNPRELYLEVRYKFKY